MSIEKTIAAIRELSDGDEVGNYEWDRINQQWQLMDILEVNGLKALADAYEAKESENAELREALKSVYETRPGPGFLYQSSDHHLCVKIAKAVLDKYK